MSEIEELLPVGTPIDLDNCAREPIHVPGSIQPRGVLLVLREPEMVVHQISANVATTLGVEVDAALGAPLSAVVGPVAAQRLQHAAESFSDLRARNPHDVQIEINGVQQSFDAIMHREPDGVLLLELEIADGPRPFSFPNTFLAVRGAVEELNRARSIAELYEVTARVVRELTGFDRVMLYRYDEYYNGEVVAEAKRDDLSSFLGLHYPSTDIPAQARALYEKNWIRLISDVSYTPVPIVPSLDPATGQPVDLTYSTLRSVSPIHVEYLQNMDVVASMSISLMRAGKLYGLVACHHYSGPHMPPFGTRAAAEFLGSTLSLRLGDRVEDDALRERIQTQEILAKIVAATLDESEPLSLALLGAPDLLDLIKADSVVVAIGDEYRTAGGPEPDRAVTAAVVRWARSARKPVVSTDRLAVSIPEQAVPSEAASGAMVVVLPDDQYIVWYRAEELHSVDWGGDPNIKAIAEREGDTVRLSPRKSFERWSEIVRNRCRAWGEYELDLGEQLQRHVITALYQRARSELRLAEALQRSLLPVLPTLSDWDLTGHYAPAAGGRIGGDWYDGFVLPDGRLAAVLGDVAGHGVRAAGRMAQLRNALRAYLFDGLPPAEALDKLNVFATGLLGSAFATVLVACVDLSTGAIEAVSAGHPVPLLADPDVGSSSPAVLVSPPIGVAGAVYRPSRFVLPRGAAMLLFSDGLIERRTEDLDVSRARLAGVLGDLGSFTAHDVSNAMGGRDDAADDATVVCVRRP